MSESPSTSTRRRFFLGAGALAAAAGTAVVASKRTSLASPLAASPDEDRFAEKTVGYKLSEHARKYYKTTLV